MLGQDWIRVQDFSIVFWTVGLMCVVQYKYKYWVLIPFSDRGRILSWKESWMTSCFLSELTHCVWSVSVTVSMFTTPDLHLNKAILAMSSTHKTEQPVCRGAIIITVIVRVCLHLNLLVHVKWSLVCFLVWSGYLTLMKRPSGLTETAYKFDIA